MPSSALLLALGAACIHALWNVLLARAKDIEAATAVAVVVWHAHRAVVPFIVASAALQLVYFTLLPMAYRLAELSVVYPIARGTAPVLVLVVGLVGLGILLVRGLGGTPGRGVPLGLLI